ncbi:MAG: hypothetical protein QM756_27440 [Polyangiaceae bacterium]
MSLLEQRLRAGIISALLALGFVAGWPKVSPGILSRLPPSIAQPLERLPELKFAILAPFRPLSDAIGIYDEEWALFATTGGLRNRICIDGRKRGAREFQLLYRAHDPEHRYLAALLEYRRMRNVWNPHRSGVSNAYDAFSQWLLRRTLSDHPELDAARVYMQEGEILPHGKGFRENGQARFAATLQRSELGR